MAYGVPGIGFEAGASRLKWRVNTEEIKFVIMHNYHNNNKIITYKNGVGRDGCWLRSVDVSVSDANI